MLKTLIAGMLAAACLPALAAKSDERPSGERPPQQSRMALCNKDAAGKKGDDRKAFMKQCLSAKVAAPTR